MNAVGPGACIILVGGLATLARADLPIFTEEAAQRGVNYTVTDGAFGGSGQYGCGVALVDLDNDGDDDLIATGNSAGQIALFANDGTGHFVDRTASSGLPAVTKVSGVVAGDYDGDGDLDLFITRWLAPAMLFRNEGGLFFANATSQALLTGISGAGAGCSFGDFDGDGDLDLAIAMRTNTNSNMMRNRFYRNNGNGTFTDISVALGVDDSFASFQCILQDLDRDGDCDLYVSNDKGMPGVAWNRYFRNEGGVFTEELESGACIAIDSMGVCAGDLDMNGHVDIYCTNIANGHALLWTGDAENYIRRDAEAGVRGYATGWGCLIFDADNDLDQDLFACSMTGAPDYLWLTEAGFPLVERSAECGIGDNLDSYALAASDIDRDGDIDLLVQNRLAPLRLYINHAPKRNNGLALRIVGSGRNTFAIGALADIEVHGRTVLREVVAGSSYKSQSSLVLHAGLGQWETADRVTVRWPITNGVREQRVLTDVPSGMVLPVYPPSRIGDADGDGRVDPADIVLCEQCVGGVFSPECAVFDADGDCRITASDLAAVRYRLCDLNRDGYVGAPDLAELLDGWGRPFLDITGDGTVGAADVATLLANW